MTNESEIERLRRENAQLKKKQRKREADEDANVAAALLYSRTGDVYLMESTLQ